MSAVAIRDDRLTSKPVPNGGRIDFWSLENQIAGRGRRYRRVVIDEAAFAKDGDNRSDDSMMAL
jgi:hypothetical protein